jgi:hypothetical protein
VIAASAPVNTYVPVITPLGEPAVGSPTTPAPGRGPAPR